MRSRRPVGRPFFQSRVACMLCWLAHGQPWPTFQQLPELSNSCRNSPTSYACIAPGAREPAAEEGVEAHGHGVANSALQ